MAITTLVKITDVLPSSPSSSTQAQNKDNLKNGMTPRVVGSTRKMFTTAFYVLLSGDNKYLPNLITICFTMQ